MKYLVLYVLLVSIISDYCLGQAISETFFQEIKTDIILPDDANKNVLKLFATGSTIKVVTANEIYNYQGGTWEKRLSGAKIQTATIDKSGIVWIATRQGIGNENKTLELSWPEAVRNDSVFCMFWEDKTLYVGTDSGLLKYNGKWASISSAVGKKVTAIAKDAKSNLWVATSDGLLKRKEGVWMNLDDYLMANGTKRNYTSLIAFDNDVLFGGPFFVGNIAGDGNHWLRTGSDGLPYGPVSSIHLSKNEMWLGTPKGAIKNDETWHYYLGKRWLSDDKVNDILPLDEHTVWIATPKGISMIQEKEMTLEQKAAVYEDIIQKRHVRRGLVNISHLTVPGDISTSKTINEDNDGLWTSTYLMAECFRYAVTGESEARQNAVRTYEALEWLEQVTGISGLPARSYAMKSDSVVQSRSPHPKIWRPSPNPEWQWLDDTSSDEIVGHILGIALFYDLVADNTQKERAKNLVQRIMNHIIDNDFHLMDYDGKPTRWGIWHPDSLNNSINWVYEKGLYSLEILSFLKAVVHLTGNPKFEETYHWLIKEHHYAENTVDAKKYGPYENSHSDDILTYFPYYSMFRYAKNDDYWLTYRKSLERTWKVSQPDKMPVWNIIASVGLEKDCDVSAAIKELQDYPLDLIDWRMENSHRWDLREDQMVDRGGQKQATCPIPVPESGISRWNTNPRRFDSGTGGAREETGSYFLFAYWMARYHGLIKE